MEHSKNYNHVPYDNMEPEKKEFGTSSQGFIMDPTCHIISNSRPPEHSFPEAKLVHHYSIQTGEEFALEFMRDRVNPRAPFVPLDSGDSLTTVHSDGIVGSSHLGSETGLGISALNIAEQGSKNFEQRNPSFYDDPSSYGSGPSVPGNSSAYSNNLNSREYASSGTSEDSSKKIKVLCSFGGKILPRLKDGKLRYVGGETRIVRINKDISGEDIWQKSRAVYSQTHTIKYQLPGEDLDTLVSVSSDEDLQNMVEECNVLGDGEGLKKLRMFLFSMDDLDDTHFGLANSCGDSNLIDLSYMETPVQSHFRSERYPREQAESQNRLSFGASKTESSPATTVSTVTGVGTTEMKSNEEKLNSNSDKPPSSGTFATTNAGNNPFGFSSNSFASSSSNSQVQVCLSGFGSSPAVSSQLLPTTGGSTVTQSVPFQFGSSSSSTIFGTSGISSSTNVSGMTSSVPGNLFGSGTTSLSTTSSPFPSASPANPFGSSASSPSPLFSFGACATNSIAALFGQSAGTSSVSTFSFTSPTATTTSMSSLSQSKPVFGSTTALRSPGSSADQMNMEDSMAEDPVHSSNPAVPVFGQPMGSSSNPAVPVFGQSSNPAVPVFGQSSNPALPVFGQSSNPVVPVFGQSSNPAVFGQSSNPAVPVFGQSSNPTLPVFGQSSNPAVPVFGQSVPVFGQSMGSSSNPAVPVFGQSSNPAVRVFGRSSNPAVPVFGQSSNPVFGQSSNPAVPVFGQSSNPALPVFGQSSNPAVFGQSSNPAVPVFGQPMGSSSNPAVPVFGQSSNPALPVFGQQPLVSSSNPTVPSFGQSGVSPSPPGFVFGAAAPSSISVSPFQFGGQQNQATPQNLPPFQASNSLVNSGGNFSLGRGGGDKGNRKIVRISKNKNRRK